MIIWLQNLLHKLCGVILLSSFGNSAKWYSLTSAVLEGAVVKANSLGVTLTKILHLCFNWRKGRKITTNFSFWLSCSQFGNTQLHWILVHLHAHSRVQGELQPQTFERLPVISRSNSEPACPPPLWLPTLSPLILISHCPPCWLQGNVGNDSPSDVFMSVAEPSVSLWCCVKVADVPPLRLIDGACLFTANFFYLLRQANPSGYPYNQLYPLWSPTRASTLHLFMPNVR